jgi:hypothetical protein
MPITSMFFRSLMVRLASLRSHLLTTCTSAISRMPALMAWMSSPRPGAETTTTVCAARAISTSAWPTPTVSMMMVSKPAASSTSTASSEARAMPPCAPRVAMLRMNTPSSLTSSLMRMRSPMMLPPEYGLEGSTAMMPTAGRWRAV